MAESSELELSWCGVERTHSAGPGRGGENTASKLPKQGSDQGFRKKGKRCDCVQHQQQQSSSPKLFGGPSCV